jgi:hypothetical protein
MLLAGTPSFAAVEARVAKGEWDFLLGWITLRAAPAARSVAWHLLLMGTDPNYRSAERPNPDSIDRRLQYYGLDRELAADFPDMPAYEHHADREVRKFQCYVLMAWWWSKGVR